MFAAPKIIAGLEIGTSKICVVVGEQGAGGALNVIGVGQSLSRGVRKGESINPKQVEEDLREAMFTAERMAGVEISSVYLGVSGGHIRSFDNRGFHRVVPPGREILPEDVEDVVNNAKAINLPVENTLIHTIRQHFLVDGQDGVTDPVGMHGSRLELDLHIVHGNTNRLQTPVTLVQSMSLKVDGVVFNGIASSLAVLTHEQKELGALVIDIGGGTTEYVVYCEGIIRHSGVLAVGGDHVTNDLAYGLKITLKRAEKLKLEHGSAFVADAAKEQTVSVTDENGFERNRVKVGHVQLIMSARLEEIFQIIAQSLEEAGLTDYLRAGVFLCGGTSRVPGIAALAEEIFHLNVTIGHASAISGLAKTLDEPEFATAIGLVKYGALQQSKPVVHLSLWASIKELIKTLVALLR